MKHLLEIRKIVLFLTALVVFGLWIFVGCTNDPFDPLSVENSAPVVQFYVTADSLNSTSYFQRTFYWSGTDEDGFVEEYFVSISTEEGVEAPWTATLNTDTTMTFATDFNGEAFAYFQLVCRDNRGALSDTVRQHIPLRNFPPIINFESDYDTLQWSYGSTNFRFFALDLDGNVTMDDSIVFWLDTADSTLASIDIDDPLADPSIRPVRKQIDNLEEGLFEIGLHGIPNPGQRTVTVSIGDEANAETRFYWSWEVLPAVGPVLLVDDFLGNTDVLTYHAHMDSIFGVEGWSLYDMAQGLPDRIWILTETFQQFEALFWYTGSSTSENIGPASGAIELYLHPEDGSDPGRLLVASKSIIGGSSSLPQGLIQDILGINRTPTQPAFFIPQDKTAFSLHPGLPDLVPTNNVSGGVGLAAMNGAEELYQMEYYQFWSPQRRPPYEPFVSVRIPHTNIDPVASAVTISLQLEYFEFQQVNDFIRGVFASELGVELP
ncbi:hypothetical protein HN388_01915 [bacterium]|jgi:hypothetical protein|nr:hypothetical protein [bacterium]MBT4291944.1 hypothetical protein [bacterium]MBT7310969.1 hypothetical protein [bacterium]